MFNYNVINPVNIHYRKYPDQDGRVNPDEQNSQKSVDADSKGERKFPNGNKVAIDYTKNQINIAQVIQDFRSTIAAINSPDEVKDEVELYLGLIAKETAKPEPSREIVLNNLKSAARVTDKYIQESLKKPSKVVQDWVEALFLQKVNLKPDETEINEEFKVKIPEKKPQQTPPNAELLAYTNKPEIQYNPSSQAQAAYMQNQGAQTSDLFPNSEDTIEFLNPTTQTPAPAPIPQSEPSAPIFETAPSYDYIPSYAPQATIEPQAEDPAIEANYTYKTEKSYLESSYTETAPKTEAPENVFKRGDRLQAKKTSYEPRNEKERLAKEALLLGKQNYANRGDLYSTLKLYDEALEYIEGSDNTDLKSAIYFERGKIFDSYNYAELALIDYHKATKCSDGNLRCHAHIKMGNIYDDYTQIEPAMNQYTHAIESAEEVNNIKGKNKALRCLASMFAGIYDNENVQSFSELALESAKEADSPKTLAKTYLEIADNYKYIGEDSKALQMYSACAQESSLRDDYETQADNFMQASMLMDKKGNKKKAYALLEKAKEYQQLAAIRKSRLNQA